MPLLTSFTLLYAAIFIVFLIFIYQQEKKDPREGKFNLVMVVITAALLALIPTTVIGLFLFAILGSTNLVTTIFSFEVSIGKLVILSIAYLAYLFTIDNIVEVLAEYILGKQLVLWQAICLFLTRSVIFFGIGELIGIGQDPSLVIAIGVALIVMLIELLYIKSQQNKETDS